MDSKKVLEKLVKIADNQQKIIVELSEKLAQVSGQPLPPQKMEPVKPELHPTQVVQNALPPNVKALIAKMDAVGNELRTTFKPGANQATVTHIQNVVNELANKNKLPFPMVVKPS